MKVIEKNVEKYVELIEKASMKGVDILVFPEHGLTTEECSMTYYSIPVAYRVYTNDTQLPDDTVFCYESDYNVIYLYLIYLNDQTLIIVFNVSIG